MTYGDMALITYICRLQNISLQIDYPYSCGTRHRGQHLGYNYHE